MDSKLKYGIVLLSVGAVLLLLGLALESAGASMLGVVIGMPGGVLVYLVRRKWYCQACGQFLGRGSRPNGCERCDSNRVTNSDPGAGDAIRVQSD